MAVVDMLLNAALTMVSVIIFFVVAVVIWKSVSYWKRYDYTCLVIERAVGGIPIISWDNGGVYVDKKTNNKLFFLKKGNVGMSADNVPYIPTSKGNKMVILHKTGLKNYRFVDLTLPNKDILDVTVGEEDLNWSLNAYEAQKKTFGTTLLEKLLPFIGLAIFGVILLGIIYVVVSKFDVLLGVAVTLEQVAEKLAQASAGTTVIQ